jgi:type IV pilus assembly protein PilW
MTLTEVMVSLLLSSLLTLALVSLFVSARRSSLQDEQLATLQEVGRYALSFLSRELEMAGFMGGFDQLEVIDNTALVAPSQSTVTQDSCLALLLDSQLGVTHFNNVDEFGQETDYSGQPTGRSLPSDCNLGYRRLVKGSDVVVIRRVKDRSMQERGFAADDLIPWVVYLSFSDLSGPASLYWGSNLHAVRALQSRSPQNELETWEFAPQLIYLREQSDVLCTDQGALPPELCRIRLKQSGYGLSPPQCLVDGVERINITFGIDGDRNGMVDQWADVAPTDLSAPIRSAAIDLLVRSAVIEPHYSDPKSYLLGRDLYDPTQDGVGCTEHHRRTSFHTAVETRNLWSLRQ